MVDDSACGRWGTIRGPVDSWVLVFLEAALAADLITASKSKQRTPPKSQKPSLMSLTYFFLVFLNYFVDVGEAALAADLIMA